MSADWFIQLHKMVFYNYNATFKSGQIIVIRSTDFTWKENE
jgi:hypothetical protein